MEILLNLAWLLLAGLMLGLWVRFADGAARHRRERLGPLSGRGMQLVSLGLLLLILFPVISVTDDLQTLQSPAETDCCQRRIHAGSVAHPVLSPIAALPVLAADGPAFGLIRMAAPGTLDSPLVENPAEASIQSRPPPAL